MLKEDTGKFPIVSSIIIWNVRNDENFHYAYKKKREIDLTLVEG